MSSYTIPIHKIPSLIYFGVLAFTFCVILVHIPRYIGRIKSKNLLIRVISEEKSGDQLLELLSGEETLSDTERTALRNITKKVQNKELDTDRYNDILGSSNYIATFIFPIFFSLLSFLSLFFYLRIVHSKNKSSRIIKTVRINSLIRDNTFIYLESDTGKDGLVLEDKSPYTDIICNICMVYQPMRSSHCNYCKKCYFKRVTHCFILDNCVHHGNQKWITQFITLRVILEVMGLCYTIVFIIYDDDDYKKILKNKRYKQDRNIANKEGYIIESGDIPNKDGDIIESRKIAEKEGFIIERREIADKEGFIVASGEIPVDEKNIVKRPTRDKISDNLNESKMVKETGDSKAKEMIISKAYNIHDQNSSPSFITHIFPSNLLEDPSFNQKFNDEMKYPVSELVYELENTKVSDNVAENTSKIALPDNKLGNIKQYHKKNMIGELSDEIVYRNGSKVFNEDENDKMTNKKSHINDTNVPPQDISQYSVIPERRKDALKYETFRTGSDKNVYSEKNGLMNTRIGIDNSSNKCIPDTPTGASQFPINISDDSEVLFFSNSIHQGLLITTFSLIVPLLAYCLFLGWKYLKFILLNTTEEEDQYLRRIREDEAMKNKYLLGFMDDGSMMEWKDRQHTRNFQFEIDFAQKFQDCYTFEKGSWEKASCEQNITNKAGIFPFDTESQINNHQEGYCSNSNEKYGYSHDMNHNECMNHKNDRCSDSNGNSDQNIEHHIYGGVIGQNSDNIDSNGHPCGYQKISIDKYLKMDEFVQHQDMDYDSSIRERFVDSLFKEPPDTSAPFPIGPISLGINDVNPYDLGYWQNWKSVMGPLEDAQMNDLTNRGTRLLRKGTIRLMAYIRAYTCPTWETEGDGRTFRTTLYYEYEDD